MPKEKRKKTALGLRNKLIISCLFFLVFAMLLAVLYKQTECKGAKLGNACYEVERADTPSTREKGLSGRTGLTNSQAMLFVFENPDQVCMWMKDMKFNIDIIWLDNEQKVTKIEENVSPETYPNAFCANNTKFVVEAKAGAVQKTGLKIGTKVNL